MKLELFLFSLCLLKSHVYGKLTPEKNDQVNREWRPVRDDELYAQSQPVRNDELDTQWRPLKEEGPYSEEANEIETQRPPHLGTDPPDHTKLIPMARYTLHNADWASIATVSVLPAIEGFPFSNVKSIADGYVSNSTGIPYFYMSPLDFTARDLSKNSRATVLVSLEETRYCETQNWDPEDPRCTRLMLTGIMKKVRQGTSEYTFAKGALFERHPAMANFPPDHDWFVAKLKIAQIAMVDYFGGAKYIPVKDYLAYNYTEILNTPLRHILYGALD